MNTLLCDGIRTPIERYAGSPASIRADDLAAVPKVTQMERHPDITWAAVDKMILGSANQANEQTVAIPCVR